MANYGYIRVSTSTQLEGYGLEQQKAVILKNYPDAVIYSDNGVSGTLLARPGLAALYNVLKPGDCVIVRELSRLWRCDWVGAEIKHYFIEHKISLVDLSDKNYQLNPNDPTIFLFQHIKEGLAQFEKMQISQKLAAARAQKRASGKYACGRAPFGYKWQIVPGAHQHKNLVIDEQAAETIRAIFKARANGESYQTIADKYGLKSRRMAKYTIENPLYKGEGAPAILSPNMWGRANKKR